MMIASAATRFSQLANLTAVIYSSYYNYVLKHSPNQVLASGLDALSRHNEHMLFDLLMVVLGAAILTAIRQFFLAQNSLLRCLQSNGILKPADADRFGESLYSFLSYTLSYTLAANIEAKKHYMGNLGKTWDDYPLTVLRPVPGPVLALYCYESAHYIHSLFVVLFLKRINTYTVVLSVHHVVAFILLALSYLARVHPFGVAVLFLHDLTDVLMQATKCITKLHIRQRPLAIIARLLRVAIFTLFVAGWFTCRLYQFPLDVISPCGAHLAATPVDSWFPAAALVYSLLLLIGLMNFYWAMLILRIIFNALTAGPEAIEDIREQDEAEVCALNDKQQANHQKNQ